jgi:hypothetical protein
MLREISEEVRVNLKDRLREARQSIRKHRHDAAGAPRMGTPFPLNGIEDLLGHAASAFDDVMTMAQTLAPRRFAGGTSGMAAQSFSVYFPTREPLAGERAFRRDLYALTKAVLAARGMEGGARIAETALASVHASFARQQAQELDALTRAQGWTDRVAVTARLTAALLAELMRRPPLHFDGTAGKRMTAEEERDTLARCLAPVAVACGLATMEAGQRSQSDMLEISTLAVDARFERIHAAFAGKDIEGDLTALFAVLLAHLP